MTDTTVIADVEACAPSSTHAIGQDAATTVAGALKSLADPLRLRMLSAIATDPRGESCVCDLAELAEVSQPTVSHHLKVLKDTGILASERRGTWVWYRITPARPGSAPSPRSWTRSRQPRSQTSRSSPRPVLRRCATWTPASPASPRNSRTN